ncbi:hypothetical protein VNO78_21103 [Psophocarpus tetragonolobus]|uniref:HVA22-like protein n=1 Tax=Psophocarpus tetragonolobus TaxID=3891 RepID=A0AAN9SAK4_PSOTE
MLGDFINRILILILGYAYPGFECYKTVEKNRVDIEELRFWCKYWIIVALFTVLEKFTDIFVGWLPMYGETKVLLFVYLWYPKTKGTGYIYETVLRPIVSRHENDIDRKIMEWKARGWDYVIYYWQYCAKSGQGVFVQALQHLVSQSSRFSSHNPTTEKSETQGENGPQAAASQAQAQAQASFMKQSSSLSKSKKWSPASETVEVHHMAQSEYDEDQDPWEPEPVLIDGDDESVSVKDRISRARARLRRLDSQQQHSPRTPRTPPVRQQQQ